MGVQLLGANELQHMAKKKTTPDQHVDLTSVSCKGHRVLSRPSNHGFLFHFFCDYTDEVRSVSNF